MHLYPAELFQASTSVPPLGLYRTQIWHKHYNRKKTWKHGHHQATFTIRAQPTWLQNFSPGRTTTDSNKCLDILNGKHETEICLHFYLHFLFLYILLWGQPLYHDLLWPNWCFCMKYNLFHHFSVTADQSVQISVEFRAFQYILCMNLFFCCTMTSGTITSFSFVWEWLGQRKGVTFLVLCSFYVSSFCLTWSFIDVCVKFVVQQ